MAADGDAGPGAPEPAAGPDGAGPDRVGLPPLEGVPVPSALPPRWARAAAVAAILAGGLCGWLIGFAFVDVQCTGDCDLAAGLGGLVGALMGAVGLAVVAVLALRAMAEWRSQNPPPPP